MTIRIIVFATLVFTSCITRRTVVYNKSEDIVEYKAFDTLEQFLCRWVKDISKVDDNIYVVIKPHHTDKDQSCLFRIYVRGYTLHSRMELIQNVVRKSNRQIRICGKLYPVIFLPIDQFFTEGDNCDNTLLYPPPLSEFIIVDMNDKSIRR